MISRARAKEQAEQARRTIAESAKANAKNTLREKERKSTSDQEQEQESLQQVRARESVLPTPVIKKQDGEIISQMDPGPDRNPSTTSRKVPDLHSESELSVHVEEVIDSTTLLKDEQVINDLQLLLEQFKESARTAIIVAKKFLRCVELDNRKGDNVTIVDRVLAFRELFTHAEFLHGIDESVQLAIPGFEKPGDASVSIIRNLYDEINVKYYSFVVNTLQSGYKDGETFHVCGT